MMDLDGKIVFKVKLDSEIKKIVIHNEDINFNELLLMMQRIFSDKIKPNDEFSIKYTDEENDLITLANDSDVSLALQDSKILKLTLFLKEESEESSEEALKPSEIVSELQKIRMSIDRFLEKFAGSLKLNEKSSAELKEESLSVATNGLHISSSTNNIYNNESHKEFDPLNKQKQEPPVEQPAQRTDTPASLNSLELSSSQLSLPQNGSAQHQQQQQQQPSNQFNQVQNQQNFNPSPTNQSSAVQQPGQFFNQQQTYQPVPQMAQPRAQMPPAPQGFQAQQQQQVKPMQFPSQAQYPQQPPVQQQQQPKMPPGHDQQGFNMNQQQQYYQQQQFPGALPPTQQNQPNFMPQQQQPSPNQNYMGGPPMPQQQQPGGGMNPYAKPPNSSLARPPSANAYSQGYK